MPMEWEESSVNQLNRRTKHGWQYGLSFSSLNVPLLSWHWQKEQTKCSGWYLRYMAVMQRPVTGLWQPAHSDPRWAWKCVSQYGRPSCSKKLPLPNGTRHSCRCTTANCQLLSLPTITTSVLAQQDNTKLQWLLRVWLLNITSPPTTNISDDSHKNRAARKLLCTVLHTTVVHNHTNNTSKPTVLNLNLGKFGYLRFM